MFAGAERFAYTDFLDFLDTYDRAASVVRTTDDYRDVTYEYLAGCAREGAIYVELIVSPDHAQLAGLSGERHLAAIARGIDEARRDHGIEARVQLVAVRNLGVDHALRRGALRGHPPPPVRGGLQPGGRRGPLPRRRLRAGVRASPRRRGWAAPSTPASGMVRRACGRRSTCP